MVQTSKQKPVQDKRKQQINVIAAAQILTILCLFKGNPAWKGSLSLLFFGVAFELFYKNQQYAEKTYRQVGALFLAAGIAFLAWFGVTG